MSDNSHNSSLPGILGLGITVAVGIASVAAYMFSRNQTEEPVRHAERPPRPQQKQQPPPENRFGATGHTLGNVNATSDVPTHYEDPCPMQKPDGQRVTYVVATLAECGFVAKLLRQHCETYRVLAIACKRSADGSLNLLQLATHKGLCVLIRLNKLPYLSQELAKILANPEIIKVGVATHNAARLLANVGIDVAGTLDLRYVAVAMNAQPGSVPEMSQQILGYLLRNGLTDTNWLADTLDKRHRDYAAEEVLAAVEIFKKLEDRYFIEGGLFDERTTATFLQTFQTNIDQEY